jgi:hypothetical protein
LALASAQNLAPGARLGEWQLKLAKLGHDNARLLATPPLSKLRDEAETRARSTEPKVSPVEKNDPAIESFTVDLSELGGPTFWQTDASLDPPRLALQTDEHHHTQGALSVSGLILLGLIVAWALSLFPVALRLFQITWPEQILLLGVVVWQVLELPLAGIALMVVGGLCRLLLLLHWGWRHLSRAAPIASPAIAGPPAGS